MSKMGPLHSSNENILDHLNRLTEACGGVRDLPTSLLYYAATTKAEALDHRHIEIIDADFLTHDETGDGGWRSALTLIETQHGPASHCIWVPPLASIGSAARRFFTCHEIAHILFDDDDRLSYDEDDKKVETEEENIRANLFAMVAVFARGAVTERMLTKVTEVLHINQLLERKFDVETVERAYDIIEQADVDP